MLNNSLKSIVCSGSAVLLVAALGTHAFGAEGEARSCRDLRSDIGAISLALGVLDGKVDQSNQSSAAIRFELGVVGAKIDRSSADLTIVRGELQQIREALEAQINGGLQMQVEADQASCASGATQCASAILPSSFNQIPVELKLLVQRDQVSVTNLEVADFQMTAAFSPHGGSDVTACSARETGCGSPEFFINRGNGGYQMWVHPPTVNWTSGTYTLLLRVSDTEGRVATKLVNVAIATGTGTPGVPPGTVAPGSPMEHERPVDTVD